MTEWFLFLPQVRMDIAQITERAVLAEESGFDGVAFIDHLETPAAADETIWEAMTLACWVAARTERIRLGHLVLCDAFRHPAVLAKQMVTLAEASRGRFELGLGSGSWPRELTRFGITDADAAARVARLEDNLIALQRYLGIVGSDQAQAPRPSRRIPLVIGGIGQHTLRLVRTYADWWNLPATEIGRLAELRGSVGSAGVSVQQMVALVHREADRTEVTRASRRRFGHLGAGLVCGDADQLAAHFGGLSAQGIQRFYVWFADFASPESLRAFATHVIDR